MYDFGIVDRLYTYAQCMIEGSYDVTVSTWIVNSWYKIVLKNCLKKGYDIDFLNDDLQNTNFLFIDSSHQPLNNSLYIYSSF